MKKLSLFVTCITLCAFGDTHKWIGESGDWSEKSNWDVGEVPGQYDTVQLAHTNALITINVDVPDGVSLSQISSSATATGKVVFVGSKIKLNGYVMLNLSGPVDFHTPIEVIYNGSRTIQYIESCKRVSFYAPITITEKLATLKFTNSSATTGGGPFYLYSTLTGPKTTVTFISPANIQPGADFDVSWLQLSASYCEQASSVYASGMHSMTGGLGTGWCYTRIFVANAFPRAVIKPFTPIGNAGIYGSFYLQDDQTFDRFDGLCSYEFTAKSVPFRIHSEKDNLLLTLNGTADGLSPIQLDQSLHLVWNPTNDFTQTFTNRTHAMTGSITVNRGAIKMAGSTSFAKVATITLGNGARFINESTVASSLAKLTTLALGDNATFTIAESAKTTPITALKKVTLGAGACLALPTDCALTTSILCLNGTYPVPGTYTGKGAANGATEVDWVTGAGTIQVENANVTSWKAAVNGNWDDDANWSGGVPTADKTVLIGVQGSDYTITATSASVWSRDMTLSSSNVTIRIPTGATLAYNGAGKTSTAQISNGAHLLIDGGTCNFTNYLGTFTLSGNDAVTSVVELTSGTFSYHTTGNTGNQMQVNEHVEIRISDGDFRDLMSNDRTGINYNGAHFNITGGKYHLAYGTDTAVTPTYLNNTSMALSGDSVLTGAKGSNISLNPPAGQTASLTFSGNAQKATTGCLYMGGTVGSTSIVTFASTATHEAFTYDTNVGYNYGVAILNVSDGVLPIAARGLHVGEGSNKSLIGDTKGIVNLSGGTITYLTGDINGWTDSRPLGITVGYGGITAATEGHPYVGEFNLSGGVFTNNYGCTIVGAGYAKGTWKQSGGLYINRYSSGTYGRGFVGALGGEGLLEMCGGSFDFKSRMYVGGGTTNDLVKGNLFAKYGLPVNNHTAQGTLAFSGGTMTFHENLVIGSNGKGKLIRTGKQGYLTIEGTLDFACQLLDEGLASETQTHATLHAIASSDGIGSIHATKATLANGTQVIVDLTAYTGKGKRFKLIDSQDLTAELTQLDVTFTDDSDKNRDTGASLAKTADGLYALLKPSGLALIFK